jgi:S-formylglutathione hydrolase FrmB
LSSNFDDALPDSHGFLYRTGMPHHPFGEIAGTLHTLSLEFGSVLDNRLGDPTCRQVTLYLPTHCPASEGRWPLLIWLAGFTSSGLKSPAWQPFAESLPQRVERLIASGQIGPCAVACPDGFTSLGGNQYVNSPVFGDWETVIARDLPAQLEAKFAIGGHRHNRAVLGRSSGGYGALVQAMKHSEQWGAVACHSGDIGFEMLYARDFAPALATLAKHRLDIRAFVGSFWQAPKVDRAALHTLMTLAMAASYDPQPDAPFGIELPVDLHTCELNDEAFDRWREHDPLRMVMKSSAQDHLLRLKNLFFDCGARDPYFSHYGARRLARQLVALEIPHTYEEFDDGHSDLDYRLDRSLPWIYQALRSS